MTSIAVRTKTRTSKQQDEEHAPVTNKGTGWLPPGYAPGYPRVAGFMACADNLAVFRKFDRISYRSLLFQQSQLLELEHELDELDTLDQDLILLNNAVRKNLELSNQEQGVPPDPKLENQRWIELILSETEDEQIIQRGVLRGPWETIYEEKLSITIRMSDPQDSRSSSEKDPLSAPAIIWGEQKDHPSAGSWMFFTHISQNEIQKVKHVPKTHVRSGAQFKRRLQDLGLTKANTIRFFIEYVAGPEGTERGYMVLSNRKQIDMEEVTDIRTVPILPSNSDKWLSKNIPPPVPLDRHDTLRLCGILHFISGQRLDALRDATIMINSSRREDLLRVDVLARIEYRMVAYKNALIQQAQSARLEKPSTRGLTTIRHWLWGKDKARIKPNRLALQGLAREIYSQKEHTDDLVAVGPPTRKDYLSRLLDYVFASVLKHRGRKVKPMQDLGETYFYSDSRMSMIASFVGSFLAVGLLIGAIVGLDQLHSKGKRLGLICALTIAFALVLIFTTTSTRGEIFGASAAYAAVLVVYVGGTLDSSASGTK